MVRGRFEIPLWIFECSHRSDRVFHQSRVVELRDVSLARLVKAPPISVLAVNGGAIYAALLERMKIERLRVLRLPLGITASSSRRGAVPRTASTTFPVSNKDFCSHRLLIKMISIHL